MATADEILAESSDVLTIDWNTRLITIPPNITNLGVESDDDVLILKFVAPRYFCEFDVSEFKAHINILNANGEDDRYDVEDLEVMADDEESITFSWRVGRFTLQYKGDVNFVVCMKKFDSDMLVEKELNTTRTILPVLEGLETDAAIVAKYPDILQSWLDKIGTKVNDGIERLELLEEETEQRITKMDNFLSNIIDVSEVAL